MYKVEFVQMYSLYICTSPDAARKRIASEVTRRAPESVQDCSDSGVQPDNQAVQLNSKLNTNLNTHLNTLPQEETAFITVYQKLVHGPNWANG